MCARFVKLCVCWITSNLVNSMIAPDELESRMNHYFEGLVVDPSNNEPDVKAELDDLFQTYKAYVKENLMAESVVHAPESSVGIMEGLMAVPAVYPVALHLFSFIDSSALWSVSLETNDTPENTELLRMILRHYDEAQDLWIVSDSLLVKSYSQLEVRDIDGSIFVFLLAQNNYKRPELSIFLISQYKFLLHQTFNFGEINLFAVWDETNTNNIYLALHLDTYYEGTCNLYLYQWIDYSYVFLHLIPTRCATVIKSFVIDSVLFLAVCHRLDVTDSTGAGNHTTLFRFNEELESLDVHQIISLSDCSSIEHSEFKSADGLKSEHLLVFTGFDGWEHGKPISTIYKLHYEFFHPFQVLSLDDVQQWLAYGPTDKPILLAVTKNTGLHLLSYHGSSYSRMHPIFESTLVNHISKFMINSTQVLVIADRGNDGTHPNIFQIPLANDNFLEEAAETLGEWYRVMARQLKSFSQLEGLEENVMSSPRVDSSEIHINGTLELASLNRNQLSLVQPLEDSLNDTREEKFAGDVEIKLSELKMVDLFVNKLLSGAGKFIVNGDLFLNELEADCLEECDLNVLSISNINGEDFDKLVTNLVNINTPKSFDASLSFSKIAVSLQIHPTYINGHPTTSLVHKKRDFIFRDGLKLTAIAISAKLYVDGLIDGVKLDFHSVLLTSSDQALNGTLLFKKGCIEYLDFNDCKC